MTDSGILDYFTFLFICLHILLMHLYDKQHLKHYSKYLFCQDFIYKLCSKEFL